MVAFQKVMGEAKGCALPGSGQAKDRVAPVTMLCHSLTSWGSHLTIPIAKA